MTWPLVSQVTKDLRCSTAGTVQQTLALVHSISCGNSEIAHDDDHNVFKQWYFNATVLN